MNILCDNRAERLVGRFIRVITPEHDGYGYVESIMGVATEQGDSGIATIKKVSLELPPENIARKNSIKWLKDHSTELEETMWSV